MGFRRFQMLILSLVLLLAAGCSAAPAEVSTREVPPQSAVITPEVEATPEPSEEPPEESTVPVEPYYFGQPVEESEAVEDGWFENAVFLGDSRTEGLQLFSGLKNGDFLWYKGMTVFRVDDPEYRRIEVDGEKLTMMEALALKQYEKVYIMIGINELGYPAASYEKGLRTMIDRVKELQPDAVIYLETLPPVNEQVAREKNLGSYIKNSNVAAFNEVIYRLAWEKEVALLDVAEVYRTEAGDLAAEMAVDGVHFYRGGYAAWYEYLRTHTLDRARYDAGVPLEEAIVPDVPVPPEYVSPSEEPTPSEEPSPSPSESLEPTPSPAPSETVPPEPEASEESVIPVPEEPGNTESVPPESPVPTEMPVPDQTPESP